MLYDAIARFKEAISLEDPYLLRKVIESTARFTSQIWRRVISPERGEIYSRS